MSKSKKNLLLLLSLMLCSALATGQTAYQKGWTEFQKNNRAAARGYFNQALDDANTKSDALLSLCLLDWNENKLTSAFENFKQFYSSRRNPQSYFYALSSMPFLRESDDILSKEQLAFFEKISNEPDMNGTMKALLCERLGAHYAKLNEQKKADEYYARMGALKNWQILGTFDNISGSGFQKDWGVVGKAQETDLFKNKVDADIHWYNPGPNKDNYWFYFDYYFSMSNAVMYAQTFVVSPEEQDAYLRVGTSGSLRVWLNDVLVSSVPEERNCDLDIYSHKVKLMRGNNRVLVQIGISEIDRANFLLRLTDEKGMPLASLRNTASYCDYSKATAQPASVEPLNFFAEDFFEAKVKEDPSNPINYYMLAETYLHNDKAYEGTKAIKALEKLHGKSTTSAYVLYEAYIRAKNQTDYEKEMEGIKATDPDAFFSLQEKFDDAIKSEKYTEAEEINKKVKSLYGAGSLTDNWDVRLASLQKRYEDLIALGRTLYQKYPERSDLMELNYAIEQNVSKNPKAAISVIENYCRKYNNQEVIDMLSKAYLEQGNTEKGLTVLFKRLDKVPYATGYYDNLINTLFKMQAYDQAYKLTQKQLTMIPFLAGGYATLGYICKNSNKANEAKDNFRKAIYYAPTSYDSRTQLRELEGKKEVYELFPKTDLQALIRKAPVAKDYPEDNAIIVLNENQMVVYPENAKEYRFEVAIKILNKAGIEDWKEYDIGYNDYNQKLIVDKSEVLKANGTSAKAETNDQGKVVFTNLEVNDVLHLEYRIQDFSGTKIAKEFFDNFQFQYSTPAMVSRYSLLVPRDKKFTYKVTNGSVEPTITDVENMKLYQWELDNQQAVKHEPNKSELLDIVPVLYLTSIPDWKYISDWYRDLTTSKFNADYVLKETLAEILKGKEQASPMEKAKLFYNYILENITYSSVSFMQSNYIPQKASRTITTRLGDCKDLSTLFVALCRQVGIDANLVLILTRDNGNHTLGLPRLAFNHCIAQLNIDKKVYYLELTDNYLPFGAALSSDLHAEILPIPFTADAAFGDKLLSMDMPGRMLNTSSRNHMISFNKNDMIINRKITNRAAVAASMRSNYKNLGEEEQLKNMNESVAKEFDIASKVSNLAFTGLNSLADSVEVSYRIDLKSALQDVAGMKIFSLPWSDKNSLNIVAAEDRKYPMEYWSYQTEDKTTEKIVMELPAGKKLAELPKNVKLECANAVYSLTFDVRTPGKMIVTRYFERKTDQISTGEYAAFRNFLNSVGEADNKQYALK